MPSHPESGLYRFLLTGFYLDRIYRTVIVRPYEAMAKVLWVHVDEGIVDRGLVGSSNIFPFISIGLRLWTTGKLSTYLLMLLLGLTIILSVVALQLWT